MYNVDVQTFEPNLELPHYQLNISFQRNSWQRDNKTIFPIHIPGAVPALLKV